MGCKHYCIRFLIKQIFFRSNIDTTEFIKKEGKFYAYVRRNTDGNDFAGKATYGIGQTTDDVTNSTTIDVSTGGVGLSSLISVDDDLFVEGTDTPLGSITAINFETNQLTIDTAVSISEESFLYALKNVRIEGGEMRGYVGNIDMEITSDDMVELFGISSEVFKSFT